AYIGRVKPDMPVEAVLDAYPDWKIAAHVIAIIPSADRSKATVKVRIALEQKDPRIVPDMGVRVSFLEQRRDNTQKLSGVLVPADAVAQRDGGSVVFVIDGDRVHRTPVTVGAQLNDMRQITQGLNPGQSVVKAPPPSLTTAPRSNRKPRTRTPDGRHRARRPKQETTMNAAIADVQPSGPLVQIRNLAKVYQRGKQKLEVLHHINLDIARGDFLALMGPSGSGKTTLLNLIGGLDSPSEGSLSVDGKRIDTLGESQLARWRAGNVGFVFQFYNLMPALTAQKNVELPLLLTKLSASQRRKNAAIALQLVGLADRASHKPAELSGGQQQRVAIARAIVSDP